MVLPPTFPDLVSLDVFCSVVTLGSVGRAAEAHGMSQPSASSRMRHLERRLGVVLLHRSPAGSRPTAAGLVVAEWARLVLDAAQELEAGVATLRARRGDRVCAAASMTIAEHLVPGWLVRLRARQPDTRIDLEVTNSATVLDAVSAGRADLGFVEHAGGTRGLTAKQVGIDELVVVVAPSHPWARRRSPVPAALLARTPLVVRERGSGTRDSLERAIAALGADPVEPVLELGSAAAVRAVVAAGTAPGAMSSMAVEADVAAGRLVIVQLVGIDLHRRLRAVWRPEAPPSGTAEALLQVASRP